MPSRRRVALTTVAVLALPALIHACVDPPPRIPAIPASGLAVRLHVFGAQAGEAREAFQLVRTNNKQFTLVNAGGDGEIVVGLETDSPKCVQPTALCSFKVAYRIRDRRGEIVSAGTTTIAASSDKCANLCSTALVNVATKIVETAAPLLVSSGPLDEGGAAEPTEAGAVVTPEPAASVADASVEAEAPKPTASAAAGPGAKKKPPAKAEPVPAKPDPVLCAVGAGARLPADEAERRAAQVDVLKRINVLDQAEYDCLRKAYLNRL